MIVRRHIPRVAVVALAGALFVVAVAAALLAAAAPATAAPGDRVWVRAISSSTLGEDFLAVAKGQQRTVYAVGYARATEETGSMLVARYAADGKRLWMRTYTAGGAGAYGCCLLVVPGGVIVAGTAGNISSPGRRDIVVAKYAGDGRRLWTMRYDGPAHRGDFPAGLASGFDGHVYVGGTSRGVKTGDDYVVLQVHEQNGDLGWARRYAGPGGGDRLEAIWGTVDEGIFVTGASADEGGTTAAATIRYDKPGRRLWVRRLHGGAGSAYGTAVTIHIDEGAVYVVGSSQGGMSSGWDMMLAKLSLATGARQWIQTATVPNGDEYGEAATFHVPAPGAGIVVTGSTTDRTTGATRGLAAAWTFDGTWSWQDEFSVGSPGTDAVFFTVTHDIHGNVYCGGLTLPAGGSDDFTVFKYGPTGAVQWDDTYDSPAHGTDVCRSLVFAHGGLFAAGFRSKTMLDTNALLIRYEP